MGAAWIDAKLGGSKCTGTSFCLLSNQVYNSTGSRSATLCLLLIWQRQMLQSNEA